MNHKGLSYRFSAAITRQPGRSVVDGLSAGKKAVPDYDKFQAEHHDYILALEQTGLNVTVLDSLEAYPDSVFIEDAALCLPEGIVMMRPGAPSRTRESTLLGATLGELGYEIVQNDSAGFIDGGDVLITDTSVLVGLSERTDRQGFEWLQSVLESWGYVTRAVQTPPQVLHFKSDCCIIDSDTVMATYRLSGADCFSPFRVLEVPRGEEAAANSIRVNDTVIVPAGHPATVDLLTGSGHRVNTIPVSQASLLDGGLSCMSLRLPA